MYGNVKDQKKDDWGNERLRKGTGLVARHLRYLDCNLIYQEFKCISRVSGRETGSVERAEAASRSLRTHCSSCLRSEVHHEF